jgi:hypothetical protein
VTFEKIALARVKAEGLFNKYLERVARNVVTPGAVPMKGIYSKSYAKNVDSLINSRAAHPEMARPYADYAALAGKNVGEGVSHRINHFRTIEQAGW